MATMASISPMQLRARPFTLLPSPQKSMPITCGPRDNRGPLVRGRTLSTEAILAVQALKRARDDEVMLDQIISTRLSRLIKPDLLAALAELQRQDQTSLALKVFVAARREPWYKPDYSLYAQMVTALARNSTTDEVDKLMLELFEEKGGGGISSEDIRGLARLVKALVAAGRGRVLKEVYGMMKRGGCQPDEFLYKVLIRGLKGVGETEAAEEVQKDYKVWMDDILPLPVR